MRAAGSAGRSDSGRPARCRARCPVTSSRVTGCLAKTTLSAFEPGCRISDAALHQLDRRHAGRRLGEDADLRLAAPGRAGSCPGRSRPGRGPGRGCGRTSLSGVSLSRRSHSRFSSLYRRRMPSDFSASPTDPVGDGRPAACRPWPSPASAALAVSASPRARARPGPGPGPVVGLRLGRLAGRRPPAGRPRAAAAAAPGRRAPAEPRMVP